MIERCSPLALVPLLLAGCSNSSVLFDGGDDLAPFINDLALGDQGPADLAMDDHVPIDLAMDGSAGGIQLTEGPCPATLNNARCYYPPGVDSGFF